MVGARQSARGKEHDEKQRRRGKGDDDRGENKRLWQRVGVERRIGRRGVAADDRRRVAAQSSRREDEEVHGIGQKRKPENRSEEHTSELQSLMRNSYDVFCLKKKKQHTRK